MEKLLMISLVFIAPVLLIGAAILAWMQGIGFRLMVKISKQQIPRFLKRFAIQLIYLLIIGIFCFIFFRNQFSSSPNNLHPIAPYFEPTKTGMLKGMIFYAVVSIFVYMVLVAAITKILTKYSYIQSVKSLTIIFLISLILYGGLIAYAYQTILIPLPSDAMELRSEYDLSLSTNNSKNEKSSGEFSSLGGVWVVDEKKSRLSCANIKDETFKAICDASVDAALIAQTGSDGILINNGILQDGSNLCKLEIRNEDGFRYSCINSSDRTIYARVNPNDDGSLSFNAAMTNLILIKKN